MIDSKLNQPGAIVKAPFLLFDSVSKTVSWLPQKRNLLAHFVRPAPRERRTVLADFSLAVRPGEKILICGPNGAGKTTLLRLAGGLLRPTAGRILVGGVPAHSSRKNQFGYMFSTSLLYTSLTGYRNLEYSAYLHGCERVGDSILSASETWGIGPLLDRLVESYSRGYRVLLALARATLHEPPILLLDEPTAYLDVQHLARLETFLKQTSKTVLAASQSADCLAGCFDRIIHL